MARKDKEKEKSRQWNIIGKYYNFKKINKGAIELLKRFRDEMITRELVGKDEIKSFFMNTEQIIADINEERFSIWEELKNLNHELPEFRSCMYRNAIYLVGGVAAYYSNFACLEILNKNFKDKNIKKVDEALYEGINGLNSNLNFFKEETINAINNRLNIPIYFTNIGKLNNAIEGNNKCFYSKKEIEKLKKNEEDVKNGKMKRMTLEEKWKASKERRIAPIVFYDQIKGTSNFSVNMQDYSNDYTIHNDMSKRQLSNNNGLSNQNNQYLPKNFNPISKLCRNK